MIAKVRLALVMIALTLLSLIPPLSARALSVGFEGYAVGTLGSALGIPGVTFVGSPDNQWLIYPGGSDVSGVFGAFVTGHILIDPVASGGPPSGLEIYFDNLQDSVSFKYVGNHNASPPNSISVSADKSGALVYSSFLPLRVQPGSDYYGGTITIPGPLNHIVLVTDGVGFGIDDLTTVESTPPAATGLGFFTDFESYALGIPAEGIPPLNGSTLSSPFIPNDWIVRESLGAFNALTGHVLWGLQCGAALNIDLDTAYTEVKFLFAYELPDALVKVDGWMGTPGAGTLVFSKDFTGVAVGSASGWLEGVASVSGAGAFDYLVIYAPSPSSPNGSCLAIDDLYVGVPAGSGVGSVQLNPNVVKIDPDVVQIVPTPQIDPNSIRAAQPLPLNKQPAPISVVCIDKLLQVFANYSDGSSALVFEVSPDMMARYAASGATQDTQVAQGAGVTLFYSNAYFRVDYLGRDGSAYSFTFDNCPARVSYTYSYDQRSQQWQMIDQQQY